MREICVVRPYRGAPLPTDTVQRMRFDARGETLLTWLGRETRLVGARVIEAARVVVHDVPSGRRVSLGHDDLDEDRMSIRDCAVSPDRRLAVVEFDLDDFEGDGLAAVIDLAKPDDPWVNLSTGTAPTGGFAFTSDGAKLLAARNNSDGEAAHAADLLRLETDPVTRPPTRFRSGINRLTRQPFRVPVRNVKWKVVAALPAGSGHSCSLAVSADARLAAVGTREGGVVAIDLKKKAVTFVNEWSGRAVRDRWALRVGFDPASNWVTKLTNGRLFANTVKRGVWKEWQTKSTLGYLHDFAYHPGGAFVAVVDVAGTARFLDPLSGTVKREFRWRRGPLYSVAFSPDGLMCAAGGEGGRVVLWDVDG